MNEQIITRYCICDELEVALVDPIGSPQITLAPGHQIKLFDKLSGTSVTTIDRTKDFIMVIDAENMLAVNQKLKLVLQNVNNPSEEVTRLLCFGLL